MSVGISLSQLIVESPDPLLSGIEELDHSLDYGFQARSIYEVYGPPGIGKTKMGLQLVQNATAANQKRDENSKVLWIETHKTLSTNLMTRSMRKACFRVRMLKFTQLLFFFQNLLKRKESDNTPAKYQLIIIDGFSQLVGDHLYYLQKRSGSDNADKNMHDIKCKHLTLLFTLMTKYTHSQGSTIILLNDCMNTAYQNGMLIPFDEDFEVIEDGSNFFVTSHINGSNLRRKNVQVLKSALLASSVAMGSRDSRWEVFIKCKIGLFWDWSDKNSDPQNKFDKCRIAIICESQSSNDTISIDQNRNGHRKRTRGDRDTNQIEKYNSPKNIIRFKCDEVTGKFVQWNAPSTPAHTKQVKTSDILPLSPLNSSCSTTRTTTLSSQEQEVIIYDSEG